ncbi:hypothetical protein BCL79_1884 [Stenotrophomonas rhizophila]|uniref:Morphogenetic protein n=1 Tax=Stenotrophomonas rhizophila TaxID=216778 RepID=A0A498CHE5_9GAMM|nr:hypothetical protein [Stenotrophomonas rhizophila]RLK57478.1 hypothetical protein BCL79_1884 [Stenotrophomonas rhizophila]
MRERPILFNGAMVRAILSGAKTQTRRAVKGVALDWLGKAQFTPEYVASPGNDLCPFGQPGDRLWVRESFTDLRGTGIEHRPNIDGPIQRYAYSADTLPGSPGDYARKDYGIKWRPSIHMPREACRLVLEITNVRVERLHDISEADALAEGIDREAMNGYARTGMHRSAGFAFRDLWTSTGGGWVSNPWVWVIEFNKINEVSNG